MKKDMQDKLGQGTGSLAGSSLGGAGPGRVSISSLDGSSNKESNSGGARI